MSEPRVAERRRSRPAPTSRLARTMRLLRWPVVIVWLVAVVAMYPAARTLSGLANGNAAANLPSSAPSTRVVELQQGPGQPDVDQAVVVFARDTRLRAADLATVASARAAVARLAGQFRGPHGYGPASGTGSPTSLRRSRWPPWSARRAGHRPRRPAREQQPAG